MANKFKNSVEFANTKMLLENYRNIQIAINCRGVDETISEMQGKNTDENCVLTTLTVTNTHALKNISADNYRLIGYLEQCIDRLRESKMGFEKGYSVLFYTYLSLEQYNFDEILEKTGLKKTAYYKNLEQAISTLAACMWGISAVKEEKFSDLCLSLVKYIPALEDENSKYESCSYLVENLPKSTSHEENEIILEMIRTLEAKISYETYLK